MYTTTIYTPRTHGPTQTASRNEFKVTLLGLCVSFSTCGHANRLTYRSNFNDVIKASQDKLPSLLLQHHAFICNRPGMMVFRCARVLFHRVRELCRRPHPPPPFAHRFARGGRCTAVDSVPLHTKAYIHTSGRGSRHRRKQNEGCYSI